MISKASVVRCMCVGLLAMAGCFVDEGRTMGASEATSTGEATSSSEATGTAGSSSTTAGEGTSSTLPTTTSGETQGSFTSDTTSTTDPTSQTGTTTTGTTGMATKTTNLPTVGSTEDPSSSTGFICNDPYEDCNGNSEDECEANLDESEEHCGMCDNPCSGACVGGFCQQSRIVFVTQDRYPGNLGGLDGADDICNENANDGNLPGNYYAWLSTSNNEPLDRFDKTDRPYVMTNNVMVALDWDDLTDGTLITGIDIDQFGQPIETGLSCTSPRAWSNTTASGQLQSNNHCQDWTSTFPMSGGNTGHPGMAGMEWTQSACSQQLCSEQMHLYCFQQ